MKSVGVLLEWRARQVACIICNISILSLLLASSYRGILINLSINVYKICLQGVKSVEVAGDFTEWEKV